MGLLRSLFSPPARPDRAAAPALDVTGRVLLLEAQWTPGQRAEYAALGPSAVEAQLAFHEGELARAHALFEELLARARSPRWLLRDVGRARYAVGDLDGAHALLTRFLELVGDELGCEARLESALDLVRVHDERGDVPAGIEALSAAVESADGSSARPYVALGQYLRVHGYLEEAREVLEIALPIEACCGGGCSKTNDAERELGLCMQALSAAR
jgi:tetratricopeptide (TPR) repeat protein